jgi:hypothetical protein
MGCVYLWSVRCINRQTKELFDRSLIFDAALCRNADEARIIEDILADSNAHRRVVAFRHAFRECNESEFAAQAKGASRFGTFSIENYFEDEGCCPLDEVELVAIAKSEPNPVILGNVSSILRQGLSEMRAPSMWSVENSNDLVHFIQIAGILQRGRWWKTKPTLSGIGDGQAYSLDNPDLECTAAALALIRQFLLCQDDVFRVAVKLYVDQVDSVAKCLWVDHELQEFESHLASDERVFPSQLLKGVTNQELIEVVVYGTGLFHRKSRHRLEDKLFRFSQAYPREELLFAFEMACRMMLKPAFTVTPLLYRDFAHWLNSGTIPRPTRVVTTTLFKGDLPPAD